MARLLCAVSAEQSTKIAESEKNSYAGLCLDEETFKTPPRQTPHNLRAEHELRDFEGIMLILLSFHGRKRKIARQHSEGQYDGRDSFYRNATLPLEKTQVLLEYRAC
eukprot:s4056_g5.t1